MQFEVLEGRCEEVATGEVQEAEEMTAIVASLSRREHERVERAALANGLRLVDFVRTAVLLYVEEVLERPTPPRYRIVRPVVRRKGRPRCEFDPMVVEEALRKAKFSIRGAARLMHVSQATLHRWISKNRLSTTSSIREKL